MLKVPRSLAKAAATSRPVSSPEATCLARVEKGFTKSRSASLTLRRAEPDTYIKGEQLDQVKPIVPGAWSPGCSTEAHHRVPASWSAASPAWGDWVIALAEIANSVH